MPQFSVNYQENCVILPSDGDRVDFKSVLAKCLIPKDFVTVPISRVLKIKPAEIKNYLIKKIGEKILRGDTLAVKKTGLLKREVKAISPVEGVLVKIDEEKGEILAGTNLVDEEILAMGKGKVVKIGSGSIAIDYDGEEYKMILGLGPLAFGVIKYLSDKDGVVDEVDIKKEEVSGKILVGAKWGRMAISKARALGALAVVSKEEIAEEIKGEFTIGRVGNEDYDKIKSCAGQRGVVFGEGKRLCVLK